MFRWPKICGAPQKKYDALNQKVFVKVGLKLESDCRHTGGCDTSNERHIRCISLDQLDKTTWKKGMVSGPHNRWGLLESPASIELKGQTLEISDDSDAPVWHHCRRFSGTISRRVLKIKVLKDDGTITNAILLRDLMNGQYVAAKRS
jgi:hypothetical protein